jgi:hypothetical protein
VHGVDQRRRTIVRVDVKTHTNKMKKYETPTKKGEMNKNNSGLHAYQCCNIEEYGLLLEWNKKCKKLK